MEALKTPSRLEQRIAEENREIINRVFGKHEKSNRPIEIEITGEKEHVKIPLSAFKFLNNILELMAQGKSISLIPLESELTTKQAAEILNVSRPHIVKLLEQGKIKYHMVGTHRRIKAKDLKKYKAKMEKERSGALDRLAKQAQELDMGY